MSGIEGWLQKLKKAEKTCIIQESKRKVHYTFEDKTEMAEDYNLKTGELIMRKWRKKSTLGAYLPWEFEVGMNADFEKKIDSVDMVESSVNPIFSRQDNLNAFQWRIRNLFYPADNYQVEINETEREIIVKTKNKKYYKKFRIPDLERVKMNISSKNLTHSFANNTLILTYQKPDEYIAMEKMIITELNKTKASKEGDLECNPS